MLRKAICVIMASLSIYPAKASEVVNIPCMIRKFDQNVLISDGNAYDKMLADHGYKTRKGKYGQNVFLVKSKFLKMTKLVEQDDVWKMGLCDFELKGQQ
jgi:hypothetical protein